MQATPPRTGDKHVTTRTAASTLAALDLTDSDPAELAVDAIVIGVYSQGPEEPAPLLLAAGAESIAAAFDGRLVDTLSLLGASGAVGEVTKLATLGAITAPLVVAVGLGPEPTGALPATETLRRAAGAAVRALSGSARVALALPVDEDPAKETIALRALTEGALLGGYRFDGYKSTPAQPRRRPPVAVSVHVSDAADKAAPATG
jgi:leucyl aminopeptidase